ncbi:hypothetical protein DM01DRAFT_323465 [Hesseltinella vesiculosa]|uniref:Uncharacterized protein n=1 Tax=Hesseltinella vesiculosa TaxID=101127 RepID=A0A1X2GY99_9FUNG|nr:hypothetical protein DM01DRAFT_323465 [Hesseltinella vesiculosa]
MDARALLSHGQGLRVFVDAENMNLSFTTVQDRSASLAERLNVIYQLRQLRSQFHHPSTNLLVRASSFWPHQCTVSR